MKNRLRWLLLGTLGAIALLALIAILLLPRLVDAESYRGVLRAKLEQQLGRPVDFGAMKLSFWPVLGLRLDELTLGRTAEERFDDPVTAASLRVGAALFPLLSGNLEVTSLIVEQPVLSLFRREDGVWEPIFSEPTKEEVPGAADDSGHSLVIERFGIRRGRIVLRRADGGESAIEQVALDVEGLGLPIPTKFVLAADIGDSAKLRAAGTLQAGELSANLQIDSLAPAVLREWLAALAPELQFPPDLLMDRPFFARASIDYRPGTPARLAISDVLLRQPGFNLLRGASGTWNYEGLTYTAPSVEPLDPTQAMILDFSGLGIEEATVRIEDLGKPLTLDGLKLSLDRLPTDRPATLELTAQVGSSSKSRLDLRGQVGPYGDDGALPLDLVLGLDAIALGDFGPWLHATERLDVSDATTTARLQLTGTIERELKVSGELKVTGATVSLISPRGDARKLPFDLIARGDLQLRDSLARIELPRLELELPRESANRALSLRGSIDARSEPLRIDLELLPTRVSADDLAALAALLAPEAPLSFASPDPVEVQLRARGRLSGDVLPDLEGRAVLSGFTFRFAGMSQPMERVGATVTFAPDRLVLDDLQGVIGKSDVRESRVTVTDFAAPRVLLDVTSRNADFWELFSFIESNEASAGTKASPPEENALSRIALEGQLRIDRGSLQTLNFEKLSTGLNFGKGVLTLQPLEMTLYGGVFSGTLIQDLDAGTLTIRGEGAGIDADGFLAQNLDLGGMIAGRASTDLDVRVQPTGSTNVLAGMSGGGPLELADGRLTSLDVLKTLSKVSGIFGERSLQQLTGRLATAGTEFRRAETRMSFAAGKLTFEDLLLETAELTLTGRTALESASGKLDGRLTVAFSPELSAAMQLEQSRAATLFWDAKSQRVRFDFGVAGLASAPKVTVDWDRALRGAAERKLTDEARGLLDRKLGVRTAPETPVETGQPDATAAPPATGLAVEITGVRWSGSVLARNLSLEGQARGAGIDRVSLAAVDTRGIEIQKFDRVRSADERLAGLADREGDATIPWRVEIDGKRLLAARFPVTVTVTVHARSGAKASSSREVSRQ